MNPCPGGGSGVSGAGGHFRTSGESASSGDQHLGGQRGRVLQNVREHLVNDGASFPTFFFAAYSWFPAMSTPRLIFLHM